MNRYSIKRLGKSIGVNRLKNVDEMITLSTNFIQDFLQVVLKRLVILLHFSNKKTIQISDINILAKFYPEYPTVFREEFPLILTKKSIREQMRKILDELDGEILVSRGAGLAIQAILEDNLKKLLFH